MSEEPVIEPNEPVLGDEPASNAEPEVTHEGFIRVDKHQKEVNNQHHKFRDAERAHAKEQEHSAKLETELAGYKKDQAHVEIPPPPDQYSETYAKDVAARDAAIEQKAKNEAGLAQAEDIKKQKSEANLADQKTAQDAQLAVFEKNMLTLGVNTTELRAAATRLATYDISDSLQDVILEDEIGPLLMQYFDQHPTELDALSGMSTYAMFNHINSTVRAKASLLKPKTSNAPDPPKQVSGGGAPESQETWEKGAVYE